MNWGYKASAEQFGPADLVRFSRHAERIGLETIALSDHFQPWRHSTGHSPNAPVLLGAIGQATERARLITSVLTPTLRYHPAIVAQEFGTLGALFPGRVVLGVGTGEAMNEIPITGGEWPSGKERRARLREAIALIRELWAGERVTFQGDFYATENATIYDKPAEPLPIYMGASGPIAAKMAGRVADGFITTSGKAPELYDTLLGAVAEGAEGRELPRFIEIKVSYDRDRAFAHDACGWWAALALSGEEKSGVEDPIEMERLADAAADRAHTRFIVSDDPDEVVEAVGRYVALGFDELCFHAPASDQERFLEQFGADVLPRLRERFG
jgi:coenzyme F420-dependent glucose-6-phosphate dehydrogenase